MRDGIRARVVVVKEEDGNVSGIGIEVYEPIIRANIVRFIGSIFVDSVITVAQGIRTAIEVLRKEYGVDCEIFIKTPHRSVKVRWVPKNGVRLRLEPRTDYSDTTLLAEDALRRKTTITERL